MEHMEPIRSLADMESFQRDILESRDPHRTVVYVCHGTGCLANGSEAVGHAFEQALNDNGFNAVVVPYVKKTGCHGFCQRGPLVVLQPMNIFYQGVSPEDVPEIVETTIKQGQPVERLLYRDPATGECVREETSIPFYAKQRRIVLRNIGKVDPKRIEDAVASGAYQGLSKAVTSMRPEEIIDAVKKSGLRGRGGAGFPTGVKWEYAARNRAKDGGTAYIVCNGDEGDPGAFMDRSIMEGDPHSVLEGMIVGAYAIGAARGHIYVRMEYPLAVKHLTVAIQQARDMGFLGENILGTGFCFDIEITQGGGAFVCGEETALLKSIMGEGGNPVPRPPFPAEKGLWGRPTVINNVETWANVPRILEGGAEWFASTGVPTSTGTKVFALVGKVNNVGLVEVPMGITVGEIVNEIGGGVPGGGRFKAVQTGGPSGGCIPWEKRDLEVDFDSLTAAGAMMGSGGMIVMDDRDCMVDVARYFLRFLEDESCGKCLPCRLGVQRMREILDGFCEGKGRLEDISEIEKLAAGVKDSSLCALGATSPNPVLTTLKYFRNEYMAHILDKRCPAAVCKALITYRILEEKCTGCGLCARSCPQECIAGEKKEPHVIDNEKCIKCGMCLDSCKFDAVQVS